MPQSLANDEALVARLKAIRPARISPVDDRASNADDGRRELCAHFDAATLAGFGCDDLPLAIVAANLALQYLKTNQPSNEPTGKLIHLKHLWTYSLANSMTLDVATRRNLELTTSLASDGKSARNLFGVLDQPVTAMGARWL